MGSRSLLLLTSDPLVVRGVTAAAASLGLSVRTAKDPPIPNPAVVVVDLDQPGAIDDVGSLRSTHADAILVGHLARPEPDRWVSAERAGCDLVANRGAVGRQLRKLLASGSHRRRFPLVDESDIAGRLGFVTVVDGTPVGNLALYHVEGRVHAVDDACPHAGARLSGGDVEGCVVTCPRHGSQFDVRTGERLRGPADREVAVHEVSNDGGRVHLVWKPS